MAKVKCGLIQMGLKGDGSMSPEKIRDRMLEAHIPFIESAADQGVQVLCFQEVFTQPYFCPSQDRKWYAAAEKIPDGHTTRLMQEYAKKHGMVIVVPIYEEHMPGVYFNTAAVIDAPKSVSQRYTRLAGGFGADSPGWAGARTRLIQELVTSRQFSRNSVGTSGVTLASANCILMHSCPLSMKR